MFAHKSEIVRGLQFHCQAEPLSMTELPLWLLKSSLLQFLLSQLRFLGFIFHLFATGENVTGFYGSSVVTLMRTLSAKDHHKKFCARSLLCIRL